MRRGHVVLLTLLPFTTIASAQAPVVAEQTHVLVNESPTVVARVSGDEVVARMMSFDRDNDGRVTKGELPERMHNLVTQGDGGGDGALDVSEIRTLANTSAARAAVRGFASSGGYTFGDQIGVSSRLHIEGALDDLRLASPTREKALAIVKTFVDTLDADATVNLLTEMESLLTAAQLAGFKTALDRQGTSRFVTLSQLKESGARVFFVGTDLGRRIDQYGLPAAQKRQALAALERFRAQLRPGDAERSALLEQMKGVLSDDERDNFRAALERRPLVKSGVVGGLVDFVKR